MEIRINLWFSLIEIYRYSHRRCKPLDACFYTNIYDCVQFFKIRILLRLFKISWQNEKIKNNYYIYCTLNLFSVQIENFIIWKLKLKSADNVDILFYDLRQLYKNLNSMKDAFFFRKSILIVEISANNCIQSCISLRLID
jgi:hypothetical protein